MRVGMIGLGAMGMPMARNIMKAGFSLGVWARKPKVVAPIRSEGAEWAKSPKELAAESDVVVLSVTNSPDVQELVAGENGLLEGFSGKASNAGASGQAARIIVDMSTIAPSTSRSLAQAAKERGVFFLDAPVSGGTQGAEAGTLTIMVGGEKEGFDQALPVLESMGKKIFHVGASGSGEVIKLVNNIPGRCYRGCNGGGPGGGRKGRCGCGDHGRSGWSKRRRQLAAGEPISAARLHRFVQARLHD